ncbi:hypothetical protein BIV57_02080 [Mangrovactinospora gilvigrisea]|uniref:Uncharacterized protein n=1 Tax=Mangrovactinospora gilvigrisea TaxID=1428644 RepID=A0A1J7BKH6_9ACTN|nr:hypothetical protein [Mangrovactinospora gilvigrisea]OIV39142.1 hypothetical protein BIV57_02080 [Mangrovactinospora gilvigrisea]
MAAIDTEEIRRLHEAENLSVNAISKRLGLSKATVRRALSDEAPVTLPEQISAPQLLALPDEDFAQLLRDNLLPREEEGPQRRAWQEFWHVLNADDDLSDRAYDTLEDFLDQTERALAQEGLEEREQKRLQKFELNLNMGWDRMERSEREQRELYRGSDKEAVRDRLTPYNAPAKRTIAALVRAIAEHRATVVDGGEPKRETDERLWSVLEDLNLSMLVPKNLK